MRAAMMIPRVPSHETHAGSLESWRLSHPQYAGPIISGVVLAASAAVGYGVAGVVGAVVAPVAVTAIWVGWAYKALPGTHGTGAFDIGVAFKPASQQQVQQTQQPAQQQLVERMQLRNVDMTPRKPHAEPILLADRFAAQFPGISSLSGPLRGKMLAQVDKILTSYLTDLVNWGAAGRHPITHTWAAWADFIAGWSIDLEKSYAAYGASTAKAAVADLRAIEAKLRWWQNNGAFYWDGPWPRAFMGGKAQYDAKFLDYWTS